MTPDDLRRLASERPVVVMGRGHSGTRVLAWALEAIGVCMGTRPEKQTGDAQDRHFTGVIKRLADREVVRDPDAAPSPSSVARFARAADGFLRWLPRHAANFESRRGWGFKFPEAYLIGPIIDEVFPKALHIHMVRDGRDLAFKEHLTDDASRRLGRRILSVIGGLREPHHLQAARSWEFQVRRFLVFEKTLGPRVLRITFEGLVESPRETMERVAAFLGLPMTDACYEFLAKDLQRGKVAQHREADRARVLEVEKAIWPTLATLGYRLGSA